MAVHAYLHRREGDAANAGYWYRRAGRQPFRGTLEEEWTALMQELMPGFEPSCVAMDIAVVLRDGLGHKRAAPLLGMTVSEQI